MTDTMPEPTLADNAATGEDEATASRTQLVGAGLFVLGLVVVWVGLDLMSGLSAWPRSIVSVVGVTALYQGFDQFVRLRYPSVEPGLVLAVGWLVLVVLVAVFAGVLPLGEHQNASATLRVPSYERPDLFSSHPLGTNQQGLDMLGRLVHGARVSLVVGIGAVAVGMFIGGMVGLIAGFYRRGVDTIVGIITDALLAFPPLVMLVALASVLDRNLRNTVIGLAILAVPTNIRLARANTMRFTELEFVQAARGMGAKNRRIILRELLPNIALPMLSYAFIIVAVLIVAEASISFLGLGIQQPKPTWGNMIAEGDGGVFEDHPHIVLVPGLTMFLTVFAFNRVGESARNSLGASELSL
ncbi:MAG: ABC transporter permease [Acidimicrobiales bacterium]